MKIYTRIDHSTLESDPRVVLKFTEKSPELPSNKAASFYLLDDSSHLVFGERSWFPPMHGNPGRWVVAR